MLKYNAHRRQAGVSIIEYIVLGAVLVLGLVYGVSQFRDSASDGLETAGGELASVASGSSLAEQYSGAAGPGAGQGLGGPAAAPGGGAPAGGQAPGGGVAAPGGGQPPAGGAVAPGAGNPNQIGNGPRDEARGPGYVRGPHYEGGRGDRDKDGTLDNAQIEGSVVRGHGEGHAGPIGGDIDAQLITGNAEISGGLNYGAGVQAKAEVAVGKGEAGVNLGPDGLPIVRGEGSGSVLSAGADGELLVGDDGRRVGLALGGKASAQAAEGRLGGGFQIPIPFTNQSIGLGGGVSGSAGSVGGNAGAHAHYDRQTGRTSLGGNLGIKALLGIGIDLNLSVGRRSKKIK